jgi:hypothetical protein
MPRTARNARPAAFVEFKRIAAFTNHNHKGGFTMQIRFLLLAVALAAAIVLSGCSKSSSSTPTSPGTTQNSAPAFPSIVVAGPKTTSSDAHATETVAYAASVNAYTNSGLFAAFTGTSGTQSGNTWTWTFTEATLSVTFNEIKQTDGSYTWSWIENGTNANTHVTYNNWTFFSGNRTADGKNGEWKVFNDNTSTLAGDFVWATNASGTLTATLSAYNSTGTFTGRYIVTNNSDSSGEVDVYTGTVLVFKATWIAAGSGSWWTYDSGTGTQTGTGTWS